jgi:hypothetical protein
MSTLEKPKRMSLYVAAGVALAGVDFVVFGVVATFFPFGAAFLDLTGFEAFAGPLVTRPDLVFPRTFFSSTMAGAWSHAVSRDTNKMAKAMTYNC